MAKGHFIITDISGYTEFLTQSELDHAHDILQSLFKAQLEHIKPPFVISSFQGDAILMYIPDTSYVQPQSVLEALENLYCSFHSTLEQMQFHTTCTCRACKGIPLLDLKMVVHHGSYLLQQMGNREELLGTDVIIPHRMLKNKVIKETGIKSYALFSEAAKEALQLQKICRPLQDHTESYEHIGDVNMVVYDLKTAWKREKAKRRKVIALEDAWVSYETEIEAPPSLVWDYLTLPNLKAQLMGLEYAKRIDDLGGRIREEAEFHCAHGELKYDYKIVDWKPFEYFTDKAKDSITGLEYYETNYFYPSEIGTRFLNCVEKPAGDVPEDAQATLQSIWNQAYSGLKSFVESDIRQGKVVV
jgi:hypothetical protein